MNPAHPQKLSKLNLSLLLVVVLLSMATLASDPGGYSPESITAFESRGRIVQLTVHPSSEYLKDLESILPLSLQLIVENAPTSSASKARWTLSSSDDPQMLLKGQFEVSDSWEDEGRGYSNLTMYSPPFCQGANSDECIPCNLEDGCTLEIKVDVCEPSPNGYYLISRFVQNDQSRVEKDCKDKEDTDQCRRIAEWLTSVDEPLVDSLCLE